MELTGCAGAVLVAYGELAFFNLRVHPGEKMECNLSIPGLERGAAFSVTSIDFWKMTRTIVVNQTSTSVQIPVGRFYMRVPRCIELHHLKGRRE
eukprot:CAMPEP_0119345682 /NCGR_PEP_ID=MMETSP1333-20130426/107614_1 /TAXON_ID=418940 /ORGANISM="Scyphosphaera apsteinii, Strain RCC1455" /LENGTH=93 /DNA_ID=CAMNT_0007358161 /DNA_START=881 /DNA_END=1162 /DNA_ORIENTATION=+